MCLAHLLSIILNCITPTLISFLHLGQYSANLISVFHTNNNYLLQKVSFRQNVYFPSPKASPRGYISFPIITQRKQIHTYILSLKCQNSLIYWAFFDRRQTVSTVLSLSQLSSSVSAPLKYTGKWNLMCFRNLPPGCSCS